MNRPPIFFNVLFGELPEPLSELWDMFSTFMHEEVGMPERWNIMQKDSHRSLKREPHELGSVIDKSGLPGFHVNTRGHSEFEMTLSLGPIGGGLVHPDSIYTKGRMLRCSFENGAKVPPSWHTLVEQICSRWVTYGGFEWDQRYNGWQSTVWAYDYVRMGGVIPPGMGRATLPSVDGIGPDRVRLDISKNPGRQSAVDGHFKAVAAEMWLGNDFWKYAPCSRDEVASADFLIDSRNYPDFVFIKAWPHPFTRPDGEQGRVQQELWQLLFHQDCEWPPGSGGISNDAVFGPIELIPERS
jgi:hypothetical protein